MATSIKLLAAIGHFNLFLSFGFDTLLEQALDRVRFAGVDVLLLTTNTVGIVSLLLSPLVLLGTVVVTLAWPGARQRMQDCIH